MFKERASRLSLLLLLAALAAGLAACGDVASSRYEGTIATAPGGKPSGELVWSNWPLYIDPGKHGTLAEFEADTGVFGSRGVSVCRTSRLARRVTGVAKMSTVRARPTGVQSTDIVRTVGAVSCLKQIYGLRRLARLHASHMVLATHEEFAATRRQRWFGS